MKRLGILRTSSYIRPFSDDVISKYSPPSYSTLPISSRTNDSPSRRVPDCLLLRGNQQIMTQTYPIKNRSDDERLVREWGFKHVFTWTDGSNAYYPPHSHRGLTTHLIRRGRLTITYPDDNSKLHNGEVKKETFGVGARIDVPAGKLHEVWIGDDGCEYVIGE